MEGTPVSWSLVDIFYPGETQRADDLEEQNRILNQRKLEKGQVSEEWVDRQQEAFDSTGSSTYNAEIAEAAAEGAAEGLASMPGKVCGALSGVAGWGLAFVPWWGWIIGAGAVFYYLGGFVYLRGILAKRSA